MARNVAEYRVVAPRACGVIIPTVDDAQRPLHVPTERIEAFIRTSDELILGRLHTQPGKSLKDEMNHNSARFIAITDARVYDASGEKLLYQADFVLLANAHVISVTPRQSVIAGRPPWFAAAPE